ncbi:hypothetical protein [Salinibacterium sp. ZJ450]|uniref:hypothetical protein n=1 Tax=Salinibacterium sp. ZJ450 TaxID=2708338 RepID=UPI00141E841F|nr:hypothetical protein [Salinibacterium sp. ZJ450]
MSARARVGQIVLCVLFVLTGVIALSTLFVDDPFPYDAQVLIASFGAAFALIGFVATLGGIGTRLVWLSLWTLPLFLASHVVTLGTWLPDAVLGAVAIVALLLSRPRGVEFAATRATREDVEQATA